MNWMLGIDGFKKIRLPLILFAFLFLFNCSIDLNAKENDLSNRLNEFLSLLDLDIAEFAISKIERFLVNPKTSKGRADTNDYYIKIEKTKSYQIRFTAIKGFEDKKYHFSNLQFKGSKINLDDRKKINEKIKNRFQNTYGEPRYTKKYDDGSSTISWWIVNNPESKWSVMLTLSSIRKGRTKGDIKITVIKDTNG